MPFLCFDLCLTAWREFETVFHGTVVGAVILDFFTTGFFLDVDDLEVDAFLFGIVTVISLTGCWTWAACTGLLVSVVWLRGMLDWLRAWDGAGCLRAGQLEKAGAASEMLH